MKNTGTLRIQAFAARQSSPVEGVTVIVSGDGFTATRLTDAEGNADDVTLTTPACALSLDENNTTQPPYAVCQPRGLQSPATAPSASRACRSFPGR